MQVQIGMQWLGRNDCCVVDCFPVAYGSWEQDGAQHIGARRLSLGRVDSGALRLWGASTEYRFTRRNLGRY